MSINLINEYRSFEVNSSIIEWDMKRAGLSLVKEFSLLPDLKIRELEVLSKKDCDVAIGNLQIKDHIFSKNLELKFTEVMNLFLKENNIDKDYDCTSIKKDACFVINKSIKHDTFGNFIRFVPKNEYHAYIYIKPLEFYFKRNGEIDLKGLVSDKRIRNQFLEVHKDGMINFLYYVVELAEKTNMDKKKMYQMLHQFVSMYKCKELDFDYYREFNLESRFRYQFLGGEIMADNIDSDMLEKVNIDYNYMHIILPLINLIC